MLVAAANAKRLRNTLIDITNGNSYIIPNILVANHDELNLQYHLLQFPKVLITDDLVLGREPLRVLSNMQMQAS